MRRFRNPQYLSVKSQPSTVQLFNHTTDDTQDSVREPYPRLTFESIDYDPAESIGDIAGFRRSKSAAGLNLTSGDTDTFDFSGTTFPTRLTGGCWSGHLKCIVERIALITISFFFTIGRISLHEQSRGFALAKQ